MSDFEQELRQVVKRREPPRDLTSAVMARIAAPGAAPEHLDVIARIRWRMTHWRPLVAAGMTALALMTGVYQYQEYRRGQEAKQQLMLALQITAQTLAGAQEKIIELNRRSTPHEQ